MNCQIIRFWINNGVNGYNPPVTVSNNPAYVISDPRVQLVDMNGDGLTDIVDTTNSNGVNAIYKTYFNNGKINFNAPITANISPVYAPASGIARFIDLNEDNKPDLIYGNPAAGVPYTLHLNNGQGGFGSALPLGNIATSYGLNNVNMVFGDINGDGRLDLIEGYSAGWRMWLNNTDSRCAKPATLIDMDNSLGMHLELKYQHLPILNMGGISSGPVISPFLFNSVKTISKRANLQGQVYTSTYNYSGGLWSLKDREFRGYKTVKIIDPDGNYSTTEFLQDDIYKGRPSWQASYDVSGNLFNKTVNTWNSQMIATGVVFPFLKRVDSYVYDGNATGRRTAQEFFYDESPQYGNITKTINYGEVDLTTGADIGTDTTISEVSYHNNTANWLIGLPKYTTVKDVNSNYLGKAWLYYDNVEDQTTLPVKGLLSKKVNWAGDAVGTVNPFSVYSYDSIGNLLSTANNAGSTTSITYDSTYKIFPLTTTNPLSQVVTNEYYGVNGVPLTGGDTTHGLWGQLKSTTDPNAQKGLKIYDALGRVTKTVSPNDTISLPTMSSDYIYGANELKVITKSRVQSGKSAVIQSVQFYDGMGRPIQAKANTEIPGQYVVTGQTEYNLRGLPVKKYGSYFTTVPLTEMTPIDTNQPATTITYDAMGRVIRTTNPDGSYANGIYDDWTTTSYDENGHMQKSYANSSGQLIKKEEYLGADGRHAAYPASTYTLYATTNYAYDLKGNLVQTTDTKGNITTIQYDALGRKISMTDPDMGTWTYGYDVDGNLLWQQDAKGQRTNFTYDVLNRLKQKSQSTGVLTVDYTYDDTLVPFGKGRLTKAAYTGGNTTFGYDNIGRELQSIKTIGSATYNVNRTYDDLNRLVTLQYPDTSKIGYTYNDAGAVNSVFEVLPTTTMPSPSGSDTVYVTSPYAQFRLNDNAADFVVLDSGLSHTNGTASSNTNVLTKPGKLSGSLSFNGTSQYVNLDTFFNKIRIENKGTFAFWIKPEAGSSVINFAGPGGAFSIEWYETNQSITFTTSGTAGTLLSCTTPANSVPFGGWAHIAVVQDGANLKIYVNGQDQSLFYWNQTNKGAWLSLLNSNISNGRMAAMNTTTTPTSNNAFFKGSLDDVRYYSNRALVPQEIWGIYNNSFGTEAENPAVTSTPPTNVTTIPHMASAFAQYKLNDSAANTAVLDATVGYNDGIASINTTSLSTAGKIGNSLTFNGTNQNVDMSSLWQDIRTDTNGSLAFWIKPVNGWPIMGFATNQGAVSIEWYKANQSLSFSVFISGTLLSFTTPTGSLPANAWSHVAIVQDGVAIKVYINGIWQQNLTYWTPTNLGAWFSSVTGTTGNAKLASSTDSPATVFFQGSFDDLRYYKKVLSATEVSALYNSALGTEDANPALGTDPTPLPPVEASTVPASAGRTFIKNIDYNANGQITKIEYGNGVTTTYTFDPILFRLTGIKSINAANATLQDFSYTYDGVGNIRTIVDRVNTANQTFTYDALNRLSTAVGTRYGSKTYTYDEIGNITAKDGLTYTYSKVAAGPHAVTSLSDGTTLVYDANGNTIRKSKTGLIMEYVYDAQNRLIQVKKNTTLVADFVYDGDGGRVSKTTYVVTDPLNHTSGALLTTPVTTKYVGELYEEANNVGTKFVYLGSRKIAAVSTADSSIMFYQEDHLGGTNITTDINGLSKEVIEYDPYGKIVRDDSTLPTNNLAKSQFTGKKIDDETGLYYYGARYYDPLLGKFITPDTIVQAPSNPQTLNRYAYCGNNPINRIDTDGHKWSWKSFFAAAIGAVLAVVTAGIAAPMIAAAWTGLSSAMVGAISGAIGGAIGGAVSAGISGGNVWQGALLGAALGGISGGGIAKFGSKFGVGMFVGGAGVAAATDSWDSFAGGFTGAIATSMIVGGLNNSAGKKGSGYQKLKAPDVDEGDYMRTLNAIRNNPLAKAEMVDDMVKAANDTSNTLSKSLAHAVESSNGSANIITPGDVTGAVSRGLTFSGVRNMPLQIGLRVTGLVSIPGKIGFFETMGSAWGGRLGFGAGVLHASVGTAVLDIYAGGTLTPLIPVAAAGGGLAGGYIGAKVFGALGRQVDNVVGTSW